MATLAFKELISYMKEVIRNNNVMISVRLYVWAFSSKYWIFIHIYGVAVIFRKLHLQYFHFRFPISRNINQKNQIKNKWKNKNKQ